MKVFQNVILYAKIINVILRSQYTLHCDFFYCAIKYIAQRGWSQDNVIALSFLHKNYFVKAYFSDIPDKNGISKAVL